MASKRAAVSRGPLDSEAVVRQVLSYVGPGHWLICALVSKKWHELYAEVQRIEQELYDYKGETCLRTITASMTLYSAVFTSVSQVELARSCGLKLRSRARPLQLAAGRNGDAETLLAARRLGMPWADCLLNSIAEQGDLPKLQVLLASNKCRLPIDVSKYAARSGSIELLKWLKQKLEKQHILVNKSLSRICTQNTGISYGIYKLVTQRLVFVKQLCCAGCCSITAHGTNTALRGSALHNKAKLM
jgi:F-box domain